MTGVRLTFDVNQVATFSILGKAVGMDCIKRAIIWIPEVGPYLS